VKKAPAILKQPESYGDRYAQHLQDKPGAAPARAAAAPADPRAVGPSLEDLDAELAQLELDEQRAVAALAAEERAKKAERAAARQAAAAATAPPVATAGLNKPSNKALLVNAVTHVLLAGGPMSALRESVLSELRASPGLHFVVVLKGGALQFRGLYVCNLDTQQAMRLAGDGPELIDSSMVSHYFKYDSAAKEFKPLTQDALTPTTAAVVLHASKATRSSKKKPGLR